MVKRKLIELGYQLAFTILGKHLVNRGQVLLIWIQFLILVNHQDERLEKIAFTVVPEVITFTGTGVADDDIGQNLCHQCVAV